MSQKTLDDGAKKQFGLVGNSPKLRGVLRTLQKLKNDRSPVLIFGESGTGKELAARAVHRSSDLCDQIFLPVDAASLAGSLMETELFGSMKGSYTSSTADKRGLVREAEGGTLFLDEIGELTIEVQAKLLRLLQESEIRPVGATRPIKVDVRVLAATNRDLTEAVAAGTFRRDLYHRLNVIRLMMPPLRERREDIGMLIRHFSQKHGDRPLDVSMEAFRILAEYRWPGNVRELENMVRRWVVLKTDPLIEATDLPADVVEATGAAIPAGSYQEGDTVVPLAELERREIMKAIQVTNGDVETAAHLLGIGRTTLYRKLKEFSLRVDELRRQAARAAALRYDGNLPGADRLSHAGKRGGDDVSPRRGSSPPVHSRF